MRRALAVAAFAAFVLFAEFAVPAAAGAGPSVGAQDDRVTQQTYVRHDGGTDPTIEACNSLDPEVFGNLAQDNEPFSVVDPSNPNLVVAGWNDYCSDWMGLGFSTNGGSTWTDSVVPGYPADDSVEGAASPLQGRANSAGDPLGAFDTHGRFYAGGISFQAEGVKTDGDVFLSSYSVVDEPYPLDYERTVIVGRGTPSRNFFGQFNDKPMLEVDRTGGPNDGNVYFCWSRFTGIGTSKIYFARSTNHGRTTSRPLAISGKPSVQGCDIAVESDGDVFVTWRVATNKARGINFARSTDGGATFSDPAAVARFTGYAPFDGARDCGDGIDLCPSGFVFARVPLEPRVTSDPTGELPGVFAIYNAVDPATVVPSGSTYSSAGPGSVGQSRVYVSRSLNDGASWSDPVTVNVQAKGYQFFADGDALAGRLAVMWQDSRTDPAYSVQRPIGNRANATSSGTDVVRSFVAVSTNGSSFGPETELSSQGNQPQYEMFDARSVPFYGDYNWIQLVERASGRLFGYATWTDDRDVVPGDDPREQAQDGFDVNQCVELLPDGTYSTNLCPNSGGLNQNIYGNSVTIP